MAAEVQQSFVPAIIPALFIVMDMAHVTLRKSMEMEHLLWTWLYPTIKPHQQYVRVISCFRTKYFRIWNQKSTLHLIFIFLQRATTHSVEHGFTHEHLTVLHWKQRRVMVSNPSQCMLILRNWSHFFVKLAMVADISLCMALRLNKFKWCALQPSHVMEWNCMVLHGLANHHVKCRVVGVILVRKRISTRWMDLEVDRINVKWIAVTDLVHEGVQVYRRVDLLNFIVVNFCSEAPQQPVWMDIVVFVDVIFLQNNVSIFGQLFSVWFLFMSMQLQQNKNLIGETFNRIECLSSSSCPNEIICPAGKNCMIQCDSCNSKKIICPTGTQCFVNCKLCQSAVIHATNSTYFEITTATNSYSLRSARMTGETCVFVFPVNF